MPPNGHKLSRSHFLTSAKNVFYDLL
uniref:LP07247p n=1 Tax=Drosophila melanogaster TaxID=7227 RepID=Q8SZG6_DROME|nr:LP07247p [Drosophila melanogaster]